ncbi:MAG TPA: Hsp20/alpha crystallin family protein [Terriglobales bacterium]|nr:Hsp20/alpha crystallin family protein [Terriglobales bacterium]
MPSRSLIRRDPFASESLDFRRNFDDFFTRMFAGPLFDRWSFGNPSANIGFIPPVETFIDQNRFNVRLALPGVKPDEVNIQVHGNELSITGERRQETTPSEERSFQREIVYGEFERVVPLPEGVQSDRMEAKFTNGVLEITAPLSEKALPRKIQIKTEATTERKLAA